MTFKKKVLLIRLDKIGDLICTLPVDQILDDGHASNNTFEPVWVVQKGLGQIIELGEKKRQYIELDKNNQKQAQQQLRQFLAVNNFEIAVSFQCPWWVNYELFKARIKKRIGVLSQWHSFLFLNHGVRQKRSQALKHEFEYNLDLVLQITGPLPQEALNHLYFYFKKPTHSNVISKYNLPLTYSVVHPGMMGSALNWKQEQYIEYIRKLILQGKTIVVTGTPTDEPYLYKIKLAFASNNQVIWLQNKLSMQELIEVIYFSEQITVPSTGVAHIAAALRKPVKGIYSPIQVHHPRRWAPRGETVTIYTPPAQCPAQFKCLGDRCTEYNCMDKLSLEE
ncbi:MAG: glycosyltransferase family 9 protein [Pseudobdellovibrio sp.]